MEAPLALMPKGPTLRVVNRRPSPWDDAEWCPAQEMLYAQSSQDLLLQSSKGPQGSRVCVLRVHGGGQTASLAPLPDGDSVFAMVWADCQGRLLVGQLEPEAALRERSCYLEDTPVAAAYHKVGGRVAPGYNQRLKNSGGLAWIGPSTGPPWGGCSRRLAAK